MAALTDQDFTMFSGDDKELVVVIKDVAGDAVNIAGLLSAIWECSKLREDGTFSSTPVISKSIGAGIELTSAGAGELTVTLDQADTEDLYGDYYHELEIVDSNSNKQTVMVGTLTIRKDLVQ